MSENPNEIDIYAMAQQLGDEGRSRGKSSVSSEAEGLQERLEKLTEKYDELYCLSRAVWELLEESTGRFTTKKLVKLDP